MWQRRELLSTAWLNVLTQRATLLQDALNRLAEIRETWRRTRDGAKASKAPGPILLQIDGVLTAIDAAEAPLRAQRTAVLDLQSAVAPEVARSQATLAQFNEAQQRAMGGILAQDSPPIWDAQVWAQARTVLPARLTRGGRQPLGGHRPVHQRPLQADALARRGRRGPRGLAGRGAPTGPSVGRVGRGQLAGHRRVRVSVFRDAGHRPAPRLHAVLADPAHRARPVRGARARRGDPADAAVGGSAAGPRVSTCSGSCSPSAASERCSRALVPIEQVILALEMLGGIAMITYSLRVGALRRSSHRGAADGTAGRLPGGRSPRHADLRRCARGRGARLHAPGAASGLGPSRQRRSWR